MVRHRLKLWALLVGVAVLVCIALWPAKADDTWRPGYELEIWKLIGSLQQYPLIAQRPEPDWTRLGQHDSPLVRTATCFAIGRARKSQQIPLLIKLLEDKSLLTRESALWALLQMEDPRIKKPVLDAIGNWENLRGLLPGVHVADLLRRIGLPYRLADANLQERRTWVQGLDVDGWKLTFDNAQDRLSYGNGLAIVTMCFETSHWDSGDPVRIRIRAARKGGSRTAKIRITDGGGRWAAIGARGDKKPRDEYHRRLSLPRDLRDTTERVFLTVAPDAAVNMDFVLSPNRKPLFPGIYLFSGFHASCPILVRVRRNNEFEKQIPGLLATVPDRKTVELLGNQRVLAAAPMLRGMPRGEARHDGGLGMAAAKALARIDGTPVTDPRAGRKRRKRPEPPDLMVGVEVAIATEREAIVTIRTATSKRAGQQVTAKRAEAFLAKHKSPKVGVMLAMLYFDMKKFDRCEEIIRSVIDDLDAAWAPSAYYFLGEVLVRRGRVAEGVEALKEAAARVKPNHAYPGIRGSLDTRTVQRVLKTAMTIPRTPGLLINSHWMRPRIKINGYMQVCANRGHYLDDTRHLRAWDPFRAEGVMIAQLPQDVRDFMPVDGERGFVAFTDGTSAVYRAGASKPVWRRELSLGFNSHLSATSKAITAADEEGTVHVLDPDSGETRWTRRTQGEKWPKVWWRSHRGLIAQNANGILIPDQAKGPSRRLEWVEADSGKTLWTYDAISGVDAVSVGSNIAAFVNRTGSVTAVDLKDGREVWRTKVAGRAGNPTNEIVVAVGKTGKHVVVALKEKLTFLSADDGRVLWGWNWKTKPDADPFERMLNVRVMLAHDRIIFVVNWDARAKGTDERTDVVILDNAGKLLLHETTPVGVAYWADNLMLKDNVLCLRKASAWETWNIAQPKTP